MEIASFQTFLAERIKVAGKAGALGDVVRLQRQDEGDCHLRRAHVQALPVPHQEVPEEAQRSRLAWRDASNKDRNVYELRYFNIAEQEDDDKRRATCSGGLGHRPLADESHNSV